MSTPLDDRCVTAAARNARVDCLIERRNHRLHVSRNGARGSHGYAIFIETLASVRMRKKTKQFQVSEHSNGNATCGHLRLRVCFCLSFVSMIGSSVCVCANAFYWLNVRTQFGSTFHPNVHIRASI